jgi:hypothetical protein
MKFFSVLESVVMRLDFFTFGKEEASPEPSNTVSKKIKRRVA